MTAHYLSWFIFANADLSMARAMAQLFVFLFTLIGILFVLFIYSYERSIGKLKEKLGVQDD